MTTTDKQVTTLAQMNEFLSHLPNWNANIRNSPINGHDYTALTLTPPSIDIPLRCEVDAYHFTNAKRTRFDIHFRSNIVVTPFRFYSSKDYRRAARRFNQTYHDHCTRYTAYVATEAQREQEKAQQLTLLQTILPQCPEGSTIYPQGIRLATGGWLYADGIKKTIYAIDLPLTLIQTEAILNMITIAHTIPAA